MKKKMRVISSGVNGEVIVRDDYGFPSLVVHRAQYVTPKAAFALALAERWGMVAAKPDGEDSAGRQKLAVLPVPELVQRACETSDAFYVEFEKRGWLGKYPAWAEIERVATELAAEKNDR